MESERNVSEKKKSILLRVSQADASHLAIVSKASRIPQSDLLREALRDLLNKYAARDRACEPAALPEAARARR